MKDDFLTIPDAPNYEINSELVVRNKSTGYILKPFFLRGQKRYQLCFGNISIIRLAETFLTQAKSSNSKVDSCWEKVPSLNNLYEINLQGELRNIKSKRLLKLKRNGCYETKINQKSICVSKKDLLWEVHGIIERKNAPLAVIAIKNKVAYKFDSLSQCARFLAPKVNYSIGNLLYKLSGCRVEKICDWEIFYQDDKIEEVKTSVTKVLKGYKQRRCKLD